MDYENMRNSETETEAGLTHLAPEVLAAASAASRSGGIPLMPGTDNVVVLPAGAALDDIEVRGRDLVIEMADGRIFVIPDGAIFVPEIVIDGVTVPPLNLAALLTSNDPVPEAGTVRSSGGNFADPVGPIQGAYDLGDLLPYTELSFPVVERREIIPNRPNRTPDVVIEDGEPATQNATDAVDEAGLPGTRPNGNVESPGSAVGNNAHSTDGRIIITSPDGIGSVTINGITVYANGEMVAHTITTPTGTLVLGDLQNGEIPYVYTLSDNTSGNNTTDLFTVIVTDSDGDVANASLTITIIDDVPTARNDTDDVPAATYTAQGGNVLTGTGTTSGATGADTRGADGATVNGFHAGTTGEFAAVGSTIPGQYGFLTLGADGNYTYTRNINTPGGVSDVFTYRIADGDGDPSTATLTINIADAAAVITSVPEIGEGTEVPESQLPPRDEEPEGSEFEAGPNATTGTITFVSPDGVASVSIGGTVITPGALPQTVVTNSTGTLVITAYSYDPVTGQGSVTYTYTLNDNTLNTDGTTVTFPIVVTDLDDDVASDTLDIKIVDDMPTAHADADSVTEDGPPTADGNVLTGSGGSDANASDGVTDTQGADGASVTAVSFGATTGTIGLALAGSYGSLTLNADGTYSYALDNSNPLVQGMDSTEHLTEVFTYSITDADGDPSTTTLTITINGANDIITINGLDGEGAEETVFEANLADGSAPDAPALTQAGTFTITSPDGLATLSVGGVTIYNGGPIVVGQTISNAYGTLTVTSLTPTTDGDGDVTGATVGYSYTLTDNTLLHTGGNAGSLTDHFAVAVTDSDGSTDTASLDVTVVDDAAIAHADVDSVTEDGPLTADGNVLTGTGGSDTNASDGVADTQGADSATVTAVSFGASEGTVGSALSGSYGSLTLNADGSYSYELDNANPLVQGLDSTETLTEVFTYSITDSDGDPATTTLTITINGANDIITINGLSVEGPDLIVDEDDLGDGSDTSKDPLTASGSFTVEGLDGISSIKIEGGEATVGQTFTTAHGTFTITSIVTNTTIGGDPTSITVGYSYLLTDNTAHPNANGENFLTESFSVAVTDTDGSTDTDTIEVRIVDDVPTANPDGIFTVAEQTPLTINVMINDVLGADSVNLDSGVVLGALPTKGIVVDNGNGTFTYTPNAGAEGADSFTYTITDADGDSSTTTVTLNLLPDSEPQVLSTTNLSVDEDGFGNANLDGAPLQVVPGETNGNEDLTNGGTAVVNFGADVPANMLAALALQDSPALDTQLKTLDGNPVTFAVEGTALVGRDTGGDLVVTISVTNAVAGPDAGDVTYSYEAVLSQPVQHPSAGTEDTVTLTGIGFEVTDSDGDTAPGSFDLSILDDVPSLAVQGDTTVVEGATATGTWNQTVGADQPGNTTTVTVGATTAALGTPIVTANGTLTVNANGTWSFVSNNNLDNDLDPSISFTVTVTDADGDVAQDTQTITITDGAVPTNGGPITLALDDQNLADGTTSAGADFDSDVASFTAGSDALTSFAFAAGTGTLGAGLTWTRVSGTLIEGRDGGNLVVSLTLTPPASIAAGATGTATVTATLHDNYDAHPTFTADDLVALGAVQVVASDQDGDSTSVTVNVTVSDDVPSLAVQGDTTVVEGATATGTWNQTVGADQPGNTTTVTVGATTAALGTPIVTANGTLTVNANGTWSFVSNNNLDNDLDPSISFTVTVTDADGDVAQDTQTITITDGAGPTNGGPITLALDDQNLADGTTPAGADFDSDVASFTAGSDALTSFAFAAGTGTLGAGLTWTRVSGTLIEGRDGGNLVVSLTLTPPASIAAGATGTATVTATLHDNYDAHPTFTADDLVALGAVQVVASDQDGDSTSVTVNATVSDDVPSLAVQGDTTVVEGATATGTWNQTVGADQPGNTTTVTVGATTAALGTPIVTANGTLTVNANGTWSFVSNNNLDNDLDPSISFTVTVTDADGDVAQDTQTITITDGAGPTNGGPITLALDDQNLADGTTPAGADFDSDVASFTAGSDALTSFAFAAGTGTLGAGLTWTRVSGTLIEGRDGGNLVVSLTLTPPASIAAGATGTATVTATLHDNYDAHPTFTADDLVALGAVQVVASDQDGDSTSVTVNATVSDDVPVVIATSGATVINSGTVSGSGIFDYAIGADGRATYSASNSDFKSIVLSGTVGSGAIGSPSVTWVSETADTALFNVSFTYLSGSTTVTETGTLTFDKGTGTYLIDLVDPIASLSISTVSNSSSIQGYEPGGSILDNTSPLVAVAQVNTNLFVQFTGYTEPGAGTGANNLQAGGNTAFVDGETLTQAADWVSISGTANGVAGDTMGKGEVLDMDFFTSNPTGNTALTPTAQVQSIFFKFDGIGASEDFIVVLKLFDTQTNTFTTKAVYVANADIFKGPGAGPGDYSSVSLDNNDGLLVIEQNDYNTALAPTRFVLVGAQVTSTDEGITGTVIDLNGAIGALGGSTGTTTFAADTNDNGFKISDIGLVSNTTVAQNASLNLAVTLIDVDGDESPVQNLAISVTNSAPPIVLDLDGDGAEFHSIGDGIAFDYAGDGQSEATAWVASDDGLLAIDLNGDGKVTNGTEIIFGSANQTDLEGLAASYDSNDDGVLDANDIDYAKFGVWQDANSNGVSDAGEFRSLDEAGIASIDLVSDGESYSAANGSVMVHGEASFTWTDGSTGILADASFATGSEVMDALLSTSMASTEDQASQELPDIRVAFDDTVDGLTVDSVVDHFAAGDASPLGASIFTDAVGLEGLLSAKVTAEGEYSTPFDFNTMLEHAEALASAHA